MTVIEEFAPGATDRSLATQSLFGFDFINAGDCSTVVDAILGPQPDDGLLPLVVTPNVDDLVRLERSDCAELAALERRARYVLPDGQPIVWTSRITGNPLSARLPGSTLFPPLWRRIVAEQRRAVIVAPSARIAARLEREHPGVGVVVPPIFEADDPEQLARVVEECRTVIARVAAEFVFIGIGFPKQQRIAVELLRSPSPDASPLLLLVGGSLDMYLDRSRRAPAWVQRAGMEWFYRFLREPRRLFRRYFIVDVQFCRLLIREVRSGRPGRTDRSTAASELGR